MRLVSQPLGRAPALWDRAARVLEREGFRSFAFRLLRKLLSPLVDFGSVTFYARDLGPAAPRHQGVDGITVRRTSPAELSSLREGFDPSQSDDELQRRFARGHWCYAAIAADGTAAHTRWLSLGRARVPELGRDVLLGPGEAYFYNGYTRADRRRTGIDGIVRCTLFETLRSRGVRRLYSYVRGDNPAGLRAAARWQRRVGRIVYVTLRGRKPWLFTSFDAGLPSLYAALDASAEDVSERTKAWRQWFEGWLAKPLSMRSTGYDPRPEEYFESTARYVASALELDPDTDVVLDLGCDSSMVTRLVAPRCRRVLGIDLIPGMLADARRADHRCGSGKPVDYAAADGRLLPVRTNAVAKAYCCGVLQTLPSAEAGFEMLEELVRVVAPGGAVLAGAIPDVGKRRQARREAWARSGLSGRLRIAAAFLSPRWMRSLVRSVAGGARRRSLILLEYDLVDWKRRFESLGFECDVLDFPESYWSRDFRQTRSNLLIRVPPSRARDSEEASRAPRPAQPVRQGITLPPVVRGCHANSTRGSAAAPNRCDPGLEPTPTQGPPLAHLLPSKAKKGKA